MRTSTALAGLALLVLLPGPAHGATGSAQPCDARCQADLERARAATERYWQVTAATADGFAELPGCQSAPQGAVGIQYANLGRSSDQTVNVERPESLLYVPEGLGYGGAQRLGAGRRLAAVEYSVPILRVGQPPPELFGRPFAGPLPTRTPGMQQYRLRVWLFSPNPDGVFADANRNEACTGSALLAPHAYEQNVHEVLGRFVVSAERVRKVLNVPRELRLREDPTGQAEVWVDARSFEWSRAEDRSATGTKWALPFVTLLAPDWMNDSADKVVTALYPFSSITDNREFSEWIRVGVGIGSDVVRYSPELALDFDPMLSETGSGYRFSSPGFVLEATVTDAAVAGSTSIRVWHESPLGMGLLRLWHDAGRLTLLAHVQVTPTPGTPLAELLGCKPGADPGSCAPVQANSGAVATTQARSQYTASVSREWWNPRHDLETGDDSSTS